MGEQTRSSGPEATDAAERSGSASPPSGATAVSDGTEPQSAVAGRRRRRPSLWVRATVWGAIGLPIAALAFLAQTQDGQRIVLERLLEIVRPTLAGELVVDDISSRTLLTGMTLVGVRLDAAEGRRFLAADSVVIRYSPLSLIAGSPRVRSTTLHGLDLEVSRRPGEDGLNVTRLLAPASDSTRATAARPIGLGRISIRQGAVEVLLPVEGPTSAPTVRAPTGETLRRLSLVIDDLDLEETVLRPGGAVVVDARLTSLSAAIHVLEEPIVVLEALGEVAYGALGLEVSQTTFRLPGSLLGGDVRFGADRPEEPWRFSADLRSEGWGALSDVRWIEPRIPAGRFRGGVGVRAVDGIEVDFRGAEIEVEASRVIANGRAHFGDVLALRDLRLTANPLGLGRLEPWLDRELPYDGFLSGEVTLGGTPDALSATGRLTLVPVGMGGAATTADFSGVLHLGSNFGATDLTVLLDPLNYRVLEPYWDGAGALAGGSARLEVNGRVEREIQVVADLAHAPGTPSASRWVGRGTFARDPDGVWVVDMSGDLSPLSIALVGLAWPDLGLQGTVAGPVRAAGRLDDLAFGGELVSGEGALAFDGVTDLTSPGSSYRLRADAESWPLSDILERAPEPMLLSASVSLEGAGFALDSLAGLAELVVRASRVGMVRIDSARAVLRAEGGVLTADTLEVRGDGTRIAGAGSLGIVPGAYGEAHFAVQVASLLELRPLLMGDSILVRDGLTPLEQDLLRVRGIEPDTLPAELDVRMAGSIEGVADVRGAIDDFALDLDVAASSAAYRHDSADSLRVSLSAGDLPATFGDWVVSAQGIGVSWAGRQFEEILLSGNMSQRQGVGTLDVRRQRNERYFATGAFAIDSLGGRVELVEASAQVNDLSWLLTHPGSIAWTGSSLTVDSLEVTRVGDDPMNLFASGTLTRGGDSSFRLEFEGFHIEDALQIAQREDLDMAGHVDLTLTVVGPAESPTINTLFEIEEPRFGAMQLSRLSGSLDYEDRSSLLRVDGWSGSRNVLTAEGVLPLDLAFADVPERRVDEPMDIRVTADSLEASIALAYLGALESVAGTVAADFRIGGTLREPQPSGTVRLRDAAWTIGALGVRHEGVSGEVLLRPDRTLTVSLETTRSGRSTVEGVVRLEPLADPALDLLVSFDRFQAVDRRDMESMISGAFRLGGTYRLPVAQGTLRVDQGTLFVEEFARAAGIVDLTDPLLLADGFAVDTTVFVSQPLLAGIRNPFLDNLRVDIDMSVPRDMWLRSDEMNVEMGGNLLVRYDRAQGDLVLVGELQALRGSYLVLGRTFEVTGGTVAFLGQAGVNPSLDIQARSRIRRRDGDPLEVLATVEGTLVQPLVTLSTEEAGLAQSDLISYLVFGRAGAELGTGGGTGLGGGFGQDLGGAAGTFAAGALANQVGVAIAQEFGLDYLAITQGEIFGDQGASNFFSTAQLEVGRYVGQDVFVVFVVSRPTQTTPEERTGVNFLRGVRVEWALTDNIFVEGFIEDRFLRSGTGGLGVSGLDGDKVVGAFIFREWGYGSDQ